MMAQRMASSRLLRALPVLWLASLGGASGSTDTGSLPALITYTFTPAPSVPQSFAAASTGSQTLDGTSATSCKANVGTAHAVGDLALVNMEYQGSCWTDGRYNNADFLVEPGMVGSYSAYRVNPPTSTFSQFLGSKTNIYFNFSTKETWNYYTISNNALVLAGVIPSSAITAGQFTNTGIRVDSLASASVLVFLPATTSVAPPASRTIRGTEATQCDLSTIESATLRDVAVVTMTGSNSKCWTDGRYNSRDYLVEYGTLAGADGSSFGAYRLNPPSTPKTQHTASHTNIYFKAAQKAAYKISSFDGQSITEEESIAASAVTAGSWIETSIQASSLQAAKIFIFHLASERFSIWPVLSSTVDGAWIGGSSAFSVAVRRFDVGGHAFTPGPDWGNGPGTHSGNYGIPKQFFPVARSDGREGVVWQDQTAHTVHMTWFSSDFLSADTLTVYTGNEYLVAAASDGNQSEIVLLLIGRTTPSSRTGSNTVKVVKASATAASNVLATKTLDSSSSGLNVHKWSSPGASMVWNVQAGTIGVVMARTMTQGGDGLNHQGAIAYVLDASSLDLIVNHGQTSGHSFGNTLLLMSDGNFLSMDMGDNYPRGINLQRFSRQKGSKRGFVVYNIKTKHGTSPTSPSGATYPVYSEISTGSTTYYKWSNDNYVYTEIGHQGLVEVSDGILVFFAGERPPLDNSKVGAVLNEARNVGFVKVGKDISTKTILSSGATETGGLYTFGGSWTAQTNQGVNWLTSSTNVDESASRVKTADLGSAGILLYWEVWTATTYQYSKCMLVDKNGQQVSSQWRMTHPMRLAIQDDLFVTGSGRVVAYAGSSNGKLMRYEVCSGTSCPGATTQQSGGNGGNGGTGGTTTVGPTQTAAPLRATMSLTLPSVAGATAAQVEAAMDTPEAKAQLASTIASGLGVSASRVTVTRVAVVTTRRLQESRRRLSATTLSVDFEVLAAEGDAAVSASVGRLADSASQENSRFAAALPSALSTAASAAGGNSVLSSLSTAVTTSGVTVGSSAAVVLTTTAPAGNTNSARASSLARYVLAVVGVALFARR